MAGAIFPPETRNTFNEKIKNDSFQHTLLIVLQALVEGPKTAVELADTFKLDDETIRRKLWWLEKYGFCARVGVGKGRGTKGSKPYLYALVIPANIYKDIQHAIIRVRGDGSAAYLGIRSTEDRQDGTSGQASQELQTVVV